MAAADVLVDLAPGAEESVLGSFFAQLVRENVARDPKKARDFRALRGSVHLVAQDEGTATTLRFDHGRLTIHDGAIGIPTVTFCADADVLRSLADVPLTRWLGLPLAWPSKGAAWRRIVEQLGRGDLRIYGLVAHPRLVTRFLRVVSVHSLEARAQPSGASFPPIG